MKLRGVLGKRGETTLVEVAIFIILNLIFFSTILYFVWRSKDNSIVYEQIYSKQFALLIDHAKPTMSFTFNIEKLVKLADKNKQPKENIFRVDDLNKEVIVSLTRSGGYSYKYFSDYKVTTSIQANFLTILVEEKDVQ